MAPGNAMPGSVMPGNEMPGTRFLKMRFLGLILSLNLPTRLLSIWACPESSSLAAALSSAVAELVWTTEDI